MFNVATSSLTPAPTAYKELVEENRFLKHENKNLTEEKSAKKASMLQR